LNPENPSPGLWLRALMQGQNWRAGNDAEKPVTISGRVISENEYPCSVHRNCGTGNLRTAEI